MNRFEDSKVPQENEYDIEEEESDSGEDSYSGNLNDSNGGTQTGRDHKSKTKRRSKNDNSGRDFICGCSKRYLSYPALYTHIKQKHKGVTPPGTNTSQLFTGRGRGRPRKTLGEVDKINVRIEQVGDGYDNDGKKGDLFNPSNLSGAGPSENEMMHMTEKVQEELQFFKDLKGIGGPTNPLEWFCPVQHISFSLSSLEQAATNQS
jgi:hypothetical protein